jgi:hypothetical protein
MTIKIIIISLLIFLFSSCTKSGFKNDNGIIFTSENLSGHYKMNISPFVDEAMEKKDKSKLANNIAAALFESSVSVDLYFNSNGNGKMKMDVGGIGRLIGVKNENIDFTYKLENDSILIINSKQEQKLTIRKFTDSFDFIELINKEENKKVELEKN